MFQHLIFFAAGIGFTYLLKLARKNHNEKFKNGEEEVCKNCKFRTVVINSIDEVETDVKDS